VCHCVCIDVQPFLLFSLRDSLRFVFSLFLLINFIFLKSISLVKQLQSFLFLLSKTKWMQFSFSITLITLAQCSTASLRCPSMMHVSEIMRFYCKPYMTSSWFLRQGALHAILHDEFWKSDHDFMIVFHINLLCGMHAFWVNEVLLQVRWQIWSHRNFSARGRFTLFYMTDSERAAMTSG